MKAWLTGLAPALFVVVTLGVAVAKLPPAPPMDPAAAEAKKAKDAATAATAAAQQAKAEDRVAARYIMEQKAKGKAVTPQMAANTAEMEAKAKEAASKVPGAQPAPPAAPAKPVAAAKPMAPKP
jgi:ABC-type microcin C transport system permease subunit YejB